MSKKNLSIEQQKKIIYGLNNELKKTQNKLLEVNTFYEKSINEFSELGLKDYAEKLRDENFADFKKNITAIHSRIEQRDKSFVKKMDNAIEQLKMKN